MVGKFALDSEQLKKVLEKTIDLFQDYQYKHGYDEPRARLEAVMDVIDSLNSCEVEERNGPHK